MAIQGIQGVVQQLQATALAAANQSEGPQTANTFAGELSAAINRISDTANAAKVQAEKYAVGVPGIGINDVMVDLQKSSVSLQMGIQVRNKLVAAYQDIMNMQV